MLLGKKLSLGAELGLVIGNDEGLLLGSPDDVGKQLSLGETEGTSLGSPDDGELLGKKLSAPDEMEGTSLGAPEVAWLLG